MIDTDDCPYQFYCQTAEYRFFKSSSSFRQNKIRYQQVQRTEAKSIVRFL